MTDPTLECKPTPHPDAVASGTCPSPSTSPDDLLGDVLGGGDNQDLGDDGSEQPGDDHSSTSPAPTEPQATTQQPVQDDDAAHLPLTGFSATAGVGIGLVLVLVGVIVLVWTRRRRAGM